MLFSITYYNRGEEKSSSNNNDLKYEEKFMTQCDCLHKKVLLFPHMKKLVKFCGLAMLGYEPSDCTTLHAPISCNFEYAPVPNNKCQFLGV